MKHHEISEKPNGRHETVQVSQKGVLYRASDKRFLVVKISGTGGFFVEHYGVLDLPGGKVNTGEEAHAALTREIQEEIGDVKTGEWILVERDVIEYPNGKVLLLGFVAQYLSGDITLSHEHSEYQWMSAEEVESSNECGEWLKRFVRGAAKFVNEAESTNDAKRIFADFENYKRRQNERMKELSALCLESIAVDLIPVLDNFHSALAHVPEDEKSGPWMIGIAHIGRQLEEALSSRGFMSFEAKPGEVFDPHFHEAVGKEGEDEGKIAKSLAPGYKIGERVIRPARVMVG